MLGQTGWKNTVFFLTAFLVLVADQFSKVWIRTYSEGQTIFQAGFFRLVRVHNTGAAFGIFPDKSLAITIIDVVLLVALLVFIFVFSSRFPFLNNKRGMLAFGLIFGGTAGNLIDRLRLGYVTDFVSVSIWPAFNVADSSVIVGVVLFIIVVLFLSGTKDADLST